MKFSPDDLVAIAKVEFPDHNPNWVEAYVKKVTG